MNKVDLLVIGGGINGAGVARDAAGHGLSVLLCDSGDIGGATSSWSTKLIHGGLRYLEYYEFQLVRKALAERERLLAIAPHITHPLGFVLPLVSGMRPGWLIRTGLFLYDHLAKREAIPGSSAVDLRHDPAGQGLRDGLARGFRYFDGWVEDNRLTVLNVMDAAARGTVVRPHTAVKRATPSDGEWQVELADGSTHQVRVIINAAGPWVSHVAHEVMGIRDAPHVRLVAGSHILVPRLNRSDDAYMLQQPDGRIVFVIPFADRFSLIGTTESAYSGDPRGARASEDEIAYLLAAANAAFTDQRTQLDVVWTYAGVRPLIEEPGKSATAASRDWKLVRHAVNGSRALSIIGGKLTTYRVLAEQVVREIAPWLGITPTSWTGSAALPGGDMPRDQLASWAERHWPWLPLALRTRLVFTYGTRLKMLLGPARSVEDLGAEVAPGIYAAELRYAQDYEYVTTAEDFLERRTKLVLSLTPDQCAAVARSLAQ